jgi:hypothetical protein
MAEDARRRHLPFEEFINFNLDMAGVDGISFETVALAMREVMRERPLEDDPSDIDRLQRTLSECQSVEIISQLMQRNPDIANIDPRVLDQIVQTSILMAFSCYNQLAERFGFEPPALSQSREDVQRLWSTLRAASGWVNKAAAEGDSVARGMAREINNTLEEIKPPNWSNNTRSLPG